MKPLLALALLFLLLETAFPNVESMCIKGCDLALASYYIPLSFNLQSLTILMQSKVLSDYQVITSFNKDSIFNGVNIKSYERINVPFPCDCIDGDFLGHVFEYTIAKGDTYEWIASRNYAMLTSVELLKKYNNYSDPNHLPLNGKLNVTVNCYCGDRQISKDYGLFVTYPLRDGDSLQTIAEKTNLDLGLLERYNQGMNFSQGSGLVFYPGKGMLLFVDLYIFFNENFSKNYSDIVGRLDGISVTA